MNKKCPGLSDNQLKAIPLILSARSITEGVERAGISRSTFYDWMQDQTFKAEFERQRRIIVDEGLHNLKLSISEAVDTLLKLLKAESEGVRLRAATSILEHISKFMETEELEQRISEIERRLNEKH